MRKIFKSTALVLAMMLAGGMATSCDSETLQQIIGMLFNTGQTYVYTGTATSQSLTGSYATNEWSYVNKETHNSQLRNMTVQLQSSQTGTLTLAPYTDGAVIVNQITIYNLAMTPTADQSRTLLSIGDNSTIDGTIVCNGVTYTAANLYIGKAEATSGNISLDMTLYFQGEKDGEDYSKAINLTYNGQATQQQ